MFVTYQTMFAISGLSRSEFVNALNLQNRPAVTGDTDTAEVAARHRFLCGLVRVVGAVRAVSTDVALTLVVPFALRWAE